MKTKILHALCCLFAVFTVTSSYGRWPTIDPKSEQYYSTSPYAYCLNNPVKHVDPDGTSTWVVAGSDGTYRVVGGSLDDKDLNIYAITFQNGQMNQTSIGVSTSMTSFYYDNDGTWRGTINMSDNSGKDFLGGLISNDPALGDYMENGTKGGMYDFKRQGGPGDNDPGFADHIYRGMSIGQTKDGTNIITSARDIGNIGAGYVAGVNGLPWGVARMGFDRLESQQNGGREGMSSQNAQRYGYDIGTGVARVEPPIMRQMRVIRNAMSIPGAARAYFK